MYLLIGVAFAAVVCASMCLWWFLVGRHNQERR
jgi:hypothetical protein